MDKRKILIIDSKTFPASDLRESLFSLDCSILDIIPNSRKVVSSIQKSIPDLILATLGSEEDIESILIVEQIKKKFPIPVIYLTKTPSNYLFLRAKKTTPVNYLFYPISGKELEIALELAFWN
ncbi:MAG: hypothetical protein NW226_08720 [Microscillaceae bacterium]|nr:hypothetical protein [Microscillaceae bacterium]